MRPRTCLGLLARARDPGDEKAWQEFFDSYRPYLHETALNAGLSEHDAAEVTQQSLIEVSRRLPNFIYDPRKGSFRSWLRKLIRWRIANHFKSRRHQFVPLESVGSDDGASGPQHPALIAAADQGAEINWRRVILETATGKVRQRLRATPRQILDRVIVGQEDISEVAESLQLKPAQASVIKFRVLGRLRHQLRLLLKNWS